MKKTTLRILITASIMSVLALSAAAYAGFEKITSDSMIEAKQISKMKDELDMNEIQSAFSGELYLDENGDEHITEGIDVECSVDDLVKKYHITSDAVENIQSGSIFDNLSDTCRYYLPIKHNGDVVGMANIKIGKPVSEIEKNLNKLNLDSNFREELLQDAKETEGKWYIASISSYVEGEGYLMPDELKNKIDEAGITDVVDVKYASIENYANEAFCVKTKNNEYIIPIDLRTYVPDNSNGELYSLTQVQNSVKNIKKPVITE